MASSEDELPNLEKEHPEESRMMTYAKELIHNMRTNVSVQDYIQGEDADFPAIKKKKKNKEEIKWMGAKGYSTWAFSND